jgi:hypothetical protein
VSARLGRLRTCTAKLRPEIDDADPGRACTATATASAAACAVVGDVAVLVFVLFLDASRFTRFSTRLSLAANDFRLDAMVEKLLVHISGTAAFYATLPCLTRLLC